MSKEYPPWHDYAAAALALLVGLAWTVGVFHVAGPALLLAGGFLAFRGWQRQRALATAGAPA